MRKKLILLAVAAFAAAAATFVAGCDCPAAEIYSTYEECRVWEGRGGSFVCECLPDECPAAAEYATYEECVSWSGRGEVPGYCDCLQ